MRYHTNTKTVLIALLITFLFFLASVFLLFELNLTSPTLIVTDYLMNKVSSVDSDISFSFDNMERNFRDRVMIRNLVVNYMGEQVAQFDTVEVKLGLFDIISYFLNLEGSAEVNLSSGFVDVSPILNSSVVSKTPEASDLLTESINSTDESDNGKATLTSFLSSHNITVSFDDVDITAGVIKGRVDNLCLSYIGEEEKLIGDVSLPSVSLDYADSEVLLNDVYLSFTYGETVFVKGTVSSASLEKENIKAGVGSLSFSANAQELGNITSGLFNAVIDIEEAESEIDALSLSLGSSQIVFSNNVITADSSSLVLDYGVIEAELKTLNFSLLSFDDFSLQFKGIKVGSSDIKTEGEGFLVKGKLSEKELEYSLSSLQSDIADKTGNNIGEVSVSSIGGAVEFSDGIEVLVNLSASLETPSEKVDDITFSLDGHIVFKDGVLNGSTLKIDELYLGYGQKYESSLSISGDLENAQIKFDYGAFDIDLTASLREKTLRGNIQVNSLDVQKILPLIIDEEISFFDSDSQFTLNSSIDISYDDILSGSLSYEFEIGSVKMSILETDISSEGLLTFSRDKILISGLTLYTSYFSLSFDGYWDLVEKLPTLDFKCFLPGGNEIVSGYIHLSQSGKIYSYYASIPALKDTFLSGNVDFSIMNEVTSSSLLTTNGTERPFSLAVELEEKSITVDSDNLSLNFDYSDGVKGALSASMLETLHSSLSDALVLDGTVDFSFSFENGLEVSSSTIRVNNIFLFPSSPSLSFRLEGRNSVFNLEDVIIETEENGIIYTGNASADLEKNILALSMNETDGNGKIVFSLYKDEEFVAALKADSINLSFLALDDMYASVSLFGRALKIEDFSFDGNISVDSPSLKSEKMNADITINGSSFSVENIVYSSEAITAEMESLSFDSSTGVLSASGGVLNILNDKAAGAMPVSLMFSLSGETEPSDSLFSTAVFLAKNKGVGSSLRFNVDKLDINSEFILQERYVSFVLIENGITADGNFLSASYNQTSGTASLSITLDEVVSATVEAEINNSIEANVKVNYFNMSLVNLIMTYPTIVFRDDKVKGEVSIIIRDGATSMNGYLTAEELGVDIFWIEDQSIILHNPRFVIWDNDLRCSLTYTTVYDKLTSERKMIRMNVGLTMNESLSIESWDADIYMDENNPVRVRIPLHLIGVDILGYVTGHYYVKSDENGMLNEGELYLSNTDVTIGMNPFPEWYKNITGRVLLDITFHIENNNRVLYPAGDDPIFSLILQEDSSVYAYSDSSSFYCTGNVDIRGGEIYYFQKYFYITSGSLSFDDPSSFNPKINLRATLRDYDSSSEKVEIYLVMKDNTFDNLSPTLESSPSKELSEIMEILGQSILSSDAYGSMSVSSVASLVTEGFDILSRLGIVTTGSNPLSSLSSSLKSVFGVDSFSLHSNILNNIVTDTISQATQSGVGSYSPMARFLSGTTLNVGKYLSQNLYLQIMVHLEARKTGDSYTIISDDLAIDTEISLEWANSAFTLTMFTRPSYFSFYSILSTFGFSISKTINF